MEAQRWASSESLTLPLILTTISKTSQFALNFVFYDRDKQILSFVF